MLCVIAAAFAGCREPQIDDNSATAGANATAVAQAEGRAPAVVTRNPVALGNGGHAPADGMADDFEVDTVDDEPDTDNASACAPKDPTLKPMQLLRFASPSAEASRERIRRTCCRLPMQASASTRT